LQVIAGERLDRRPNCCTVFSQKVDNHEILAAIAVGKWEAVMKKVVITQSVQVALRTLDDETRRRVNAWFEHLANWDGDEYVRSHSHSLDSIPGVYVLKTSTDLRIFFTMQGNTVTIIDIAKKQSIITSGQTLGAD
jgi:mRNA-degrading endonuclease RelE of RelBE toxin-antitoxin system